MKCQPQLNSAAFKPFLRQYFPAAHEWEIDKLAAFYDLIIRSSDARMVYVRVIILAPALAGLFWLRRIFLCFKIILVRMLSKISD